MRIRFVGKYNFSFVFKMLSNKIFSFLASKDGDIKFF